MENKGPIVAAGIVLLLIAISAGGYFFSRQYINPPLDNTQNNTNNITTNEEENNSFYTLNNNSYYDENIIEYDPTGGLSIPGTITRLNNDESFEFESNDIRIDKTYSVSFSNQFPNILVMFANLSDYPPSTAIWETIDIPNINEILEKGTKVVLISENITSQEATNLLREENKVTIDKLIIFNQ